MDSGSGNIQHKGLFWKTVVILLLAAVGYNIYSGVMLKKVEIPGLFSVEFDSHNNKPEPSKHDIGEKTEVSVPVQAVTTAPVASASENALKTRIRALENRLTSPDRQASRTDIQLSGLWESDEGLQYLFEQTGKQVAFQELNPVLGVTAEGSGTINGSIIQFTYTTAFGTVGSARLVLSTEDDEELLTGTFTDHTSGVSMPIELYR